MPQIIPIKDLKNTAEISALCHSNDEPVFVTKNGYGDMVLMSMEVYEKSILLHDVTSKLATAEEAVNSGDVADAKKSLGALRSRYDL